jgi:hypothetical protein
MGDVVQAAVPHNSRGINNGNSRLAPPRILVIVFAVWGVVSCRSSYDTVIDATDDDEAKQVWQSSRQHVVAEGNRLYTDSQSTLTVR